jgi:hypothetical protein
MKTVIGTFLVLLTMNSCTMAQNDKKNKMDENNTMSTEKGASTVEVINSNKEISINISAEKLWEIIGPGFAEYDKWATIVDHAEGKGNSDLEGAPHDERVCSVNNGQPGPNEVTEKVLDYSDEGMNLKYEAIQGMPPMMAYATNQMTVVSNSDSTSKLVVNMEWGINGPMNDEMNTMMQGGMTSTMDVFLNDAKVYAETAMLSDSKQLRVAELNNN